MEYTKIFLPVIQIETQWVLIVLTVQFNWKLDQIDIVGVYLNVTLPDNEVLYIDPIPGLYNSSNKVYRVVKLLYRLKQARHI